MTVHLTQRIALQDVAQDHELISMGITPSGTGDLHYGHYVTLFNVMNALAVRDSLRARIFVDDREYHAQKPPILPRPEVTARVEDHLDLFLRKSAAHLHEEDLSPRVEVKRMSDCVREPGIHQDTWGMDFLELLAGHPQLLQAHYGAVGHFVSRPAIAICEHCHHGNSKSSNFVANDFSEVRGRCFNASCVGFEQTTRAQVAAGENNWAVFYALVGFRDALLAQSHGAVLHVYGGDYGQAWGPDGRPKATRMSGVVQGLLDQKGVTTPVNHYVGPLLTQHGKKLSKSSGDRVEDDAIDFNLLERILAQRAAVVELS